MSGKKNDVKAMDYALKAVDFFEKRSNAKAMPELVMGLHLLAAAKCRLGHYEEVIQILKKSLAMYTPEMGSEHTFGAFAGHMQLGDTYSMLGQYEDALQSYHAGLKIQKQFLGDMDCRVAHSCLYIAESHLQAMQFKEAEELCEQALKIHIEQCGIDSEEVISDRKLMVLALTGKGNHEKALENLFLARETLLVNRKDVEVANVDASIGDTYLALGLYDEAGAAYQKALPFFEWVHGKDSIIVAALSLSLAEVCLKKGTIRESKSYCENALRIYARVKVGQFPDEIASGLTEVAGLFESMGEYEHSLRLFQQALEILEKIPGQQSEVAAIEAQIGVLFHVIGKYEEAYMALKSAVCKFRCGIHRKTWFLGMLLNLMGLACLGLDALWDATEIFEEAKSILDEVCGPHHADSLAISSNLAGAYDALGRTDDAISLLEQILDVNEGRLGTLHPDVEGDRQRLKELLNESGRSRTKKTNSLRDLLLSSRAQSSRFQFKGIA
ncbi:protein KINESIN LIGHT CHAIN-RELATED 1 isoform X2 [Cryptomeria japonica]|nr:protein KINESIN LIGHT CHAIN-RELATED 1 isoform X2 [Cryptomeria japonica]